MKNVKPTSQQISSKDVHLSSKLKTLQPGQNTKSELSNHNFIQELLDREITTGSTLPALSYLDEDGEIANLTDSTSEDDAEDLLCELEKIRKEKEVQKLKQQEIEEKQRNKRIISNNPLIHVEESSAKIKKHWKDDCIFKNQAQPSSSTSSEKSYVNDILRSDRHKSFMEKYVK